MKVKIGNYPTYRFYHGLLYSWFNYSPKQSVKVKIDEWDTYSMDHTLAKIILPMLKQLKETNHGYPGTLTKDKWDEIMDKMIYAFEHKMLEDGMFDTSDQKKIQEGFRLFGRYYQNLWD